MTTNLDKIQNLLPLGYLYLIILGIVKESLYYYQLDINILKYSSIMDILISPIADLTSEPIILIAVIFMIALSILLQFLLSRNSHKKWVQKFIGQKDSEKVLSKEEIKATISRVFVVFCMTALSSFFFGLGIGNGMKMVKKIKTNKLTYNHKISFDSDKTEEVCLFDNNSSYYFYLTKGNKNIKIAPVGSIKSVELINNKKLK
ncbi:hypothetical protein [Dyadobacter psychrotolerans]|uniref:Uncharacterized protein n=1 Tax=Dyadobacter psychrotolerans TaxID=2541721 RepID=A0A4R5E292_9BACT|nr:hypothetical protein [Dyadobacter psychrotolerans]TDE18405.1 hypothetical protein E0F88_02375 [Dyadobacter psychrotolerans]